MTVTEVLLSIGWYEWIFYSIIFLVVFCCLFNVELTYTFNVVEHYSSPFFQTLWYSIFIPDKYLKNTNYDKTKVRQLELMLNGLGSGVVELSRDERYACELREISKKKRYPLKFYVSDMNNTVIDGDAVCLPAEQLIQVLTLWEDSEKEQKSKKKSLLT